MLEDEKTVFDWVGHINADTHTLSRELRLSEPNDEFVNRLLMAIVRSATEIAELRQAEADAARRAKWEQEHK
jgi:hypothetical protein